MYIDSKSIKQFEKLKALLNKGSDFGIDTALLISKIDNVIKAMKDKTIRIVLLGSFSDGKTSAIAGLLGKLKENMKIDQDESSDEIVVYRFDDVDNVEIIDTPGLFGTKEKEIDGRNVRYSEITERYISESNILVYVSDAVIPLKDSHVEILRKIFRDFGKLKSTVFVLNKMDEAGFDMLDEEDYLRGVDIKKQTLIKRLKDTMNLTDEESEELNIVCISADPKGRGLEYWFNKIDAYRERSHIGLLQESINKIVSTDDIHKLKNDTNYAVLKDVITEVQNQVTTAIAPIDDKVHEAKLLNADIQQDCTGLRRSLIAAKGRLLEDLRTLSRSILIDLDETDQSTIAGFIEHRLGMSEGNIDYNILDSDISQAISRCVESNNYAVTTRIEAFNNKMNIQQTIIKDAVKFGVDKLGNVKLTNVDVLKVRNFLAQHFDWAKNIKFKPKGAGKLAGKITKSANVIAVVLNIGLDLHGYFKEKKELKKFMELKDSLKSDISAKFKDIYDILNCEDSYFREFAPIYLEMNSAVEERNRELSLLEKQISLLRQYNCQLNDWLTYANNQTN